jgi:alpha-glucosidase
MPHHPQPHAASPWWRGATIYQIYPRSFADSNGDGIGDLPGITAHLDHVASLGVDGIWISPFFTSPMADFGYDVADYRDVDPIFGSLADFDALVARAHALGLKVTIDLVFAHTSDHQAWFAESRADRTNAKADWYVWADPKPDGTPPCNWQSVFGGPAWTWDARRCQYYMHQFLKEQPQLNVHNPAVQQALLDVTRFWLERGVDGFRFDALNHAMFDPLLRNNGVAPADGSPRTRPFDFQDRRRSQDDPGVVPFIERIAAVCGEYDAIFTVAEVGGNRVEPLMKAYTAGDARLASAYSFAFLYAPDLTPHRVKAALAQWPGRPDRHGPNAGMAEGWPSWAFDNHDAPRSVSRWCPAGATPAERDRWARLEIAVLMALRGNIFIYQGQELGLEQDVIPFHLLQDPEAIANWPLTLGRDGVRTPIPWAADQPNGGFTTGTPWLPLSPGNIARAVGAQTGDPASLLHHTRQLIALRQSSPALRGGTLKRCVAKGDLLAFTRQTEGETIHCAFNLGSEELVLRKLGGAVLLSVNGGSPEWLAPFGAVFVRA